MKEFKLSDSYKQAVLRNYQIEGEHYYQLVKEGIRIREGMASNNEGIVIYKAVLEYLDQIRENKVKQNN